MIFLNGSLSVSSFFFIQHTPLPTLKIRIGSTSLNLFWILSDLNMVKSTHTGSNINMHT